MICWAFKEGVLASSSFSDCEWIVRWRYYFSNRRGDSQTKLSVCRNMPSLFTTEGFREVRTFEWVPCLNNSYLRPATASWWLSVPVLWADAKTSWHDEAWVRTVWWQNKRLDVNTHQLQSICLSVSYIFIPFYVFVLGIWAKTDFFLKLHCCYFIAYIYCYQS